MSRLPEVSPTVARRRAVFLVLCSVVVIAVGAWVVGLLAGLVGSGGPGQAQAAPESTSKLGRVPTPQPDCLLQVAGSPVALSFGLARTLTDEAGRDQNSAQTDAFTAARVRVLWPAEAAQADAVTASLRGLAGPALSCTAVPGTGPVQTLGADGLTPRAEAVWVAVGKVFGVLPAGGFMPGGVTTGHVPGSAHYEGRAIDYMYRPVTAKSLAHGWVLAQWLVAHAEPLLVQTVIFDKKIWVPGADPTTAWSDYTVTYGQVEDPTLQHLDHVHVDVARGK